MPVDPYIARGVQPIDVSNTLLDIARLKQVQQENDRRDRYQSALIDDRQRAYTQEQHQQELKQGLARIRWLKSQPSIVETLRSDPARAAELSKNIGMDVLNTPEPQVKAKLDELEARFASDLGVGPPQPEYRSAGNQIVQVPTQPGEAFKPVYTAPREYAPHYVDPTAEQRNFEYRARLAAADAKDGGHRVADFDRMNPPTGSTAQPHIYQGGLTGDQYTRFDPTTNSMVPVPTAGAPSPSGPHGGPGVPTFRTEAEAQAAEAAGTLKKGTRVVIGGVSGTWQ